MTGKTFTYLCTILCSVVLASLISDVNAKAYKSSYRSHNSHSSHASHSYPSSHGGMSGSHHSGSHSTHSSHTYPTHSSGGSSGGAITQHKYPSSHSYPSNSMSGGSSGVHSYPSSSGTAHAYPSSHSMSGGGSSAVHSYPSAGVSNTVHSYPSAGGSNAVHSYPSSSGSHGYPPSNTLSGTGTKPGSASYPPSNTLSGTGTKPASYPASPGLSGGSHYPSGGSSYPHHTNPNNNIHHSTSWGSQPIHHTNSHTVVHHHHYNYRPPSVIHYHTSSGLVSYPVYTGTLPPYVYEYRSSGNKYSYLLAGLALYNLGKMSSDSRMHSYHQHYNPQPDEYCKFGVRYRSGVSEEMSVDCRSITYFIYQENQPGSMLSAEMNKNMQQANALVNANTQQVLSSSGVLMQGSAPVNTITTTTTQAYSVTDPRFYGSPIDVRPDMECYVSRVNRYSNIVKPVPCDLLQTYSKQSLYRRNSAPGLKSSFVALVVSFAYLLY